MSRSNKNMMDRIQFFDYMLALFFLVFCAVMIYPFIYVLSTSLTPPDISTTVLRFFTPRVDFSAYVKVFRNDYIPRGFYNSVARVLLGTSIQVIAVICCAYALSRKDFPDRTMWTAVIVFTMYFSGGLIPTYLLIRDLGLIDNIFVYILPALIPTFSMLIMRNFFMALPESLGESAALDGANDIVILLRIIAPISMPIIATVILWQVVGHWNAWFDCMIYMRNPKNTVLMLRLRNMLIEGRDEISETVSAIGGASVNSETMKAAVTMTVTIPIILTYPFLQKYFIKGVIVGSLKG